MTKWESGLPPGKYYEGMTDDFEVYFSPLGMKWHRRRSAEDREQHRARREAAKAMRDESATPK